MSTTYNGRVFNAQVIENQPLEVVWDGQLLDSDMIGIVAGTAHLDAALELVRFASRPQVQASISRYISYGPVRFSAARFVSKHLETGVDMRPHSLADTLGLEDCGEDDLYAAMDWLLERRDAIERRLAKRHLKDGALVLYDLTSVWLEGRRCPLARRGYSRDGKHGKLQIEFGLLCDAEGRPVAVEVFDGNTADPATVGAQIDKLRHRFGLSKVVLVGDRGMLTEARIREEVRPSGLDWISALRGPAVRSLVESGAVQLSLFDETDLVEIRSDAYPGERLMVCRNPLVAQERARKREELLRATEALLDPIVAAARREQRRLKGADKIGLRVGKVVGKYKMAKHFELDIEEDAFGYRRKSESIAAEAALDGLYVVRTSLPASELDAEGAVRFHRGAGAGLRSRQGKSPRQTHRQRSAGAQLPHPARRPGDDHQEPGRPLSARRRAVRDPHPAHRATARSFQALGRASIGCTQ